jgi:hypothetical protein
MGPRRSLKSSPTTLPAAGASEGIEQAVDYAINQDLRRHQRSRRPQLVFLQQLVFAYFRATMRK